MVAAMCVTALIASASPATASGHEEPQVCPLQGSPLGWDPTVTSYTVPPDPSGVLGDEHLCSLSGFALDLGGDGVEELLLSTFHLSWLLIVRSDGVGEWMRMNDEVGDFWSEDFNGDGVTDVWWEGEEGGGLAIFLNTPSGTLEHGLSIPAWFDDQDWRWPIYAVADFDEDGVKDLAFADGVSRELAVAFGSDGRRVSVTNLSVDTIRVDISVLDVNGDGLADVAVRQAVGAFDQDNGYYTHIEWGEPVYYVNDGAGGFHQFALDTTPPTITAVVAPDANSAGWNNTAVSVTFSCTDDSGDVAICGPDRLLTEDGTYSGLTGEAVDEAGNRTVSDPVRDIRIDQTAPVVTFTGNSGQYMVDQQVSIDCTATDNLSGVAENDCVNVLAPAYGLGLGEHMLTATATDLAGNTSTASTQFSIAVTGDSLKNLVSQFSANQGVARSLHAKVDAIMSAQHKAASDGARTAFTEQVHAQTGKSLTRYEGEVLLRLVAALVV